MSDRILHITSKSIEQTHAIGTLIGRLACLGDVIALIGDLGSGKTTLTQGIAKGLAVPEEYYVTSPSFTLINEYPGRVPLYHFDAYRLTDFRDMEAMGYEEYFYGSGVVVIEWAEKVYELLPEPTLYLYIANLNNMRQIDISCQTEKILALERVLKEGGYI
ncbi:MAG: tRNA (adenosine(37)-N6)-threonylcarbamoyltransferase complex ATPase subunit type 1 TsaE [Syntrophales bacterium]|jgi:tRNA threonylcarbamoyladenosine biosynthesis protein TsaE|nr:tRNA (adenosine(37)-N6)-threonylcarbamoyltransferase complex ATPase subunit type 1 TsaE [Syntrophales bacterium]MDY0044835.1 tRNA (adenosine(37)-N6)-threonylcarbamoyltransferase complex ATPase subunit type 1 TsaE [Syntrophales bacterium]